MTGKAFTQDFIQIDPKIMEMFDDQMNYSGNQSWQPASVPKHFTEDFNMSPTDVRAGAFDFPVIPDARSEIVVLEEILKELKEIKLLLAGK